MRPWWIAAVLVAGACAPETEPDAYGNVEAIEVTVSSETGGRLLAFDVSEGDELATDASVGTIDSGPMALDRTRVEAERAAADSRIEEIARQIEALGAQRAAAEARRAALETERTIAQRTYERVRRLHDQQAATAPELDRAERDYRALVDQVAVQDQEIAARASQIDAARVQQQTARRQLAAVDAQLAQASDRIRRAEVRNPVAGTVLAVYARAGEFVQPGQPLYKVADLTTVDVRAYVVETQLALIRVGQDVQVGVDAGDARRALNGTLSWISPEAQFTPTPIQTREERADLVYALKVRTPNPDGVLKIGMPVDVRFATATRAQP